MELESGPKDQEKIGENAPKKVKKNEIEKVGISNLDYLLSKEVTFLFWSIYCANMTIF